MSAGTIFYWLQNPPSSVYKERGTNKQRMLSHFFIDYKIHPPLFKKEKTLAKEMNVGTIVHWLQNLPSSV